MSVTERPNAVAALVGVAMAASLLATVPATAAVEGVPLDRPGGLFHDDDGGIFEADLEALGRDGTLLGCDDVLARVCPTDELTRGQLASVLARGLGLAGDGEVGFDDVDPAGPHATGIDALSDEGVVEGCGPDLYCPTETVTRGQLAAMLARALDLPPSDEQPFTDVDGPFADEVAAVAAAGITEGCAPDLYCPTDAVTRGQLAGLLVPALELDPITPPPTFDGTIAFVRDGRIEVTDVTGTGLQLVSDPADGNEDFSPSLATDGGVAWLRFSRPDRSSLVRVGPSVDGPFRTVPDAFQPSLSPDGDLLVVVRDVDPGFTSEPVLVDTRTGEETALLDRPSRPDPDTGEWAPLAWSPDSSLVLLALRPPDCLCEAPSDVWAYDVEADTLTLLDSVAGQVEASTPTADWSEVGIVAGLNRADNDGSTDTEAHVVDLTTYQRTPLADPPGDRVDALVLSPSGDRVVIASYERDTEEAVLHVRDRETGEQVELVRYADTTEAPTVTWSPDGEWLLVSVETDFTEGATYVLPPDGITPQRKLDLLGARWTTTPGWLLGVARRSDDGPRDIVLEHADGTDHLPVVLDAPSGGITFTR